MTGNVTNLTCEKSASCWQLNGGRYWQASSSDDNKLEKGGSPGVLNDTNTRTLERAQLCYSAVKILHMASNTECRYIFCVGLLLFVESALYLHSSIVT